jgi:hypothetical protein
MKLLVALLILLTSSAATCQEWNGNNCNASLERAYSFFAVRPNASTQGDFNGDGALDFAVFLDGKAHSGRSAIGVCLSKEPRPLLITNPYQSSKIFTKPKGTAYLDFDTDDRGVYELDSISVSDDAWLGASYILRGGVFARVVDRD